MPYQRGAEPPHGYTCKTRPNLGLMFSGLAVFANFWAISLVWAQYEPGQEVLAVPFVGPFLSSGQPSVYERDRVLYWVGFSQIGGAALFWASFHASSRYWVRTDLALTTLGPAVVGGGYGLVAAGTL